MNRHPELSARTGLAALAVLTAVLITVLPSLAGSTLAQPKLEAPRAQPRVGRNATVQIKALPRGQGVYLASEDVAAIDSARQADVVSRSVPPGDYLLLAKLVVVNDAGSPAAVACGLHAGDYDPAAGRNGVDYASITVTGRSRTLVTLTGAYTNPGPVNRNVRVSCQTSSGSRLVARWIKLTASAVEAIDDPTRAKKRTPRARPRTR